MTPMWWVALTVAVLAVAVVSWWQLLQAGALIDAQSFGHRARELLGARSAARIVRWRLVGHGLTALGLTGILLGGLHGSAGFAVPLARRQFGQPDPGLGDETAGLVASVVLTSLLLTMYLLMHDAGRNRTASSPLKAWVTRVLPFEPRTFRQPDCSEQLDTIRACAEQSWQDDWQSAYDSRYERADEMLGHVMHLSPPRFMDRVRALYAVHLGSPKVVDWREEKLRAALARTRAHLDGLPDDAVGEEKAWAYAVALRLMAADLGSETLAELRIPNPGRPPRIPELDQPVTDLAAPGVVDLREPAEHDEPDR